MCEFFFNIFFFLRNFLILVLFENNGNIRKYRSKRVKNISTFFFLVNHASIIKLRHHKSVTKMASFITSQEDFHHRRWVIQNKVV